MTAPSPAVQSALAGLTVDELRTRLGDLAYQSQMAALEAIPVPADVAAEAEAITAELARRATGAPATQR